MAPIVIIDTPAFILPPAMEGVTFLGCWVREDCEDEPVDLYHKKNEHGLPDSFDHIILVEGTEEWQIDSASIQYVLTSPIPYYQGDSPFRQGANLALRRRLV